MNNLTDYQKSILKWALWALIIAALAFTGVKYPEPGNIPEFPDEFIYEEGVTPVELGTTHFSGLAVTGDTSVGGDLTVTGSSTIGSTGLDLNGATLTIDADGDSALVEASDDLVTFTPGAATGSLEIRTGNFQIGNGTPGETHDGEDFYCEGISEFDGSAYFDGAVDMDSTLDTADTATFSKGSGNAVVISAGGTLSLPATADIAAGGYVAVGNGTPNGAVTAGTDEQFYVEGATEIDGAVDADSTLNVADTATFSKGSGYAIVIAAGGTLSLPATADILAYGYTAIGDGTPNGAVTAGTNEQLYCEGAFEVDGAVDADSTMNVADTATFSKGSGDAVVISAGGTLSLPATADVSAYGYVAVGNGTPNGSVTAGTDEQLYVEGATEIDGAIDADSTLNVAGAVTFQGAFYSSFADLTVSDGDTVTPTYTTYALDSAGNVTITLAATGTEGQLLILIGDDANDITINDTNVRTNNGAAQVLNAYDVIMWVYQDSEWIEISESNNS